MRALATITLDSGPRATADLLATVVLSSIVKTDSDYGMSSGVRGAAPAACSR